MVKVQLLGLAVAAVLLGSAAARDLPFEAHAPAPLPSRKNTTISFKEKMVLICADTFSLLLSVSPVIIRYHTGSWFTTRNIFPAKMVVCNFGAAAMWTIYMKIQMYLSSGYTGLDAMVINCITCVISAAVLICYFIKGKEFIKFAVWLVAFVVLAISFLVLLVLYQSSRSPSHTQITFMHRFSNGLAISGIAVFIVLNCIPFIDLCEMSWPREGYENVTLYWHMLLWTLLNCFVSSLWAFYAWVFPADAPNYFMIANLIAAILSVIQFLWLGGICFHHQKVEGQIMDVESLRVSFLMLSETLNEIAMLPAAHASWSRIEDLADHVSNGAQSLSQIKAACEDASRELDVKVRAATASEDSIKDRATNLAANARTIIAAADEAAKQGTAVAATAVLNATEGEGLKAFNEATEAIKSSVLPQLLGVQETQRAAESSTREEELKALHDGTNDNRSSPLPPRGITQETQRSTDQQTNPTATVSATGALRLSKDLQTKAAAVVSSSVSLSMELATFAATKIDAGAACHSCNDLIAACNMCITAFECNQNCYHQENRGCPPKSPGS